MEQNTSKSKKIVWLFLILILPIFFFFFLSYFGKNRYNLTIYYPIDSTKVENRWQVRYHTLPDFTFVNQYGDKITRASMKGKVCVTDFFFTKCGNPTLCPRLSKEMARVQEMFAKNTNVLLLSHTVDPENDTPKVLQQYAKSYGAIRNKWHFLTGAKQDIYDLAYQGYKINAGQEKDAVTPEFLHATKFILLDAEGRVRGYYDGIDSKDVDRLITEINILLYEMKL